MQLSTKGRYAVMALAEIARHKPGACVPLQEIALRQKLPADYLEQLFMKLRRAGLIVSARGPGGGYRLSRSARTISVAEVMSAVDEPFKMTRCEDGGEAGCLGDERCVTHDLWEALGDHLVDFLSGVSLKDVVDGRFSKRGACADLFRRWTFNSRPAPRVVA